MHTLTAKKVKPAESWMNNVLRRPRQYMGIVVNTCNDFDGDTWTEVSLCESEALAWLTANGMAKGAREDGFKKARAGVLDLSTGIVKPCDNGEPFKILPHQFC